MNRDELHELLEQVSQGAVSVDEAQLRMSAAPFVDLGFAKPDLHRGVRTGAHEVIYGAGKTAEQIVDIAQALLSGGQKSILVTRVDDEKAHQVRELMQTREAFVGVEYDHHAVARIVLLGERPRQTGNAYVVVACAGTSDLYCAEEAALTAEAMGSEVRRVYDVGVAGIHRLLSYLDVFQEASAVVAVAGMEGALASVIGGMCPCPVIACPTSVGYGASFNGLAALLSMLNSCSSGTSVVNIDNGFGAGYQAALIDHARVRGQEV
ncbi:MAG: nickel pincer cofactor biosynthesis protein LarB [Coriobacteriales bacterium]|nr:nickel pincer cofactor biosynthesis protein LarB [Coriobacteriales bacterium]